MASGSGKPRSRRRTPELFDRQQMKNERAWYTCSLRSLARGARPSVDRVIRSRAGDLCLAVQPIGNPEFSRIWRAACAWGSSTFDRREWELSVIEQARSVMLERGGETNLSYRVRANTIATIAARIATAHASQVSGW